MKLLWVMLLCAQTAGAAAQPAQTVSPPVPSQREAPSIAPTLPSAVNAKGAGEKQPADVEGNEYWPPVFGYKLKITDTFATLALWVATKRLVQGADDTARRQLRAYVGLEKISITFVGSPPNAVARIEYKNFGKTPAYKIACRLYLASRPNPLLAPMDIRASDSLGLLDLMPNHQNLSHPDLLLDYFADPLDAIRRQEVAVYLLGEVVYLDSFGNKFRDEITMMTTGQRAWSSDPFVFVDRSELTRAR